MGKKFDICHVLAKENMAFRKYPAIHKLGDIVCDLGEVFKLPKGGDAPIRSQGSRWISHKRQALQRLIDRYGAYISHLTSLLVDSSINSTDKAKLKG